MKKLPTNWQNVPADITKYIGFTYLIINKINEQKYIGKKFFWFTNRIKVEGRKNRKIVTKESDWKTYESSDHEVKSDIIKFKKENFDFIILDCYKTKRELTYAEVEQQFKRDVLTKKLPNGLYEYYNSNISGRYFRQIL